MTDWNAVKAQVWTAPWDRLQQAGLVAHADAILAHPGRFRAHVERFVETLRGVRGALDRLRRGGLDPVQLTALDTRYAVLVAGLLAEPGDDRVEGAPLLAVAGVTVGLLGIAWAVVAYQYAAHLREQTALAERELAARVQASEQGRTLQPSTLPAAPDARLGWALLGGLALGAAVLAWRGRPA